MVRTFFLLGLLMLVRLCCAQEVHAEETSIRLAPGTLKRVAIYAPALAKLQVRSSEPAVASARMTSGYLEIRALATGRTIINVNDGVTMALIGVVVQDYAFRSQQTLTAEVTGRPALADTVKGAIEAAVKLKLKAAEGADVRIQSIESKQIQPGQFNTFTVKVLAFAPDCVPTEGVVHVVVKNVPINVPKESELWYCNVPERLTKPGPVFSGSLTPGKSVRLLYHHVNDILEPLFFNVQVVNESDSPARLMVLNGDSTPGRNPVTVGAIAGAEYLHKWKFGSYEIVDVAPHSTIPLSIRNLYPQQVASGLCTMQLLPGGPESLLIRADARKPFDITPAWASAIHSSTPWRTVPPMMVSNYDEPVGAPSSFVFPNPVKEIESIYNAGERFRFIRLGSDPIVRQDQGEVLDGNYGVLYRIKCRIQNPSDEVAKVELVFEASAGFANALFLVDGTEIQSNLLKPHEEFTLKRLELNPKQTRIVELITFPLSGSAYPCTLTLRPPGSTIKFGQVFGKKGTNN